MRPYRVFAIENGTVIDHITHGCALKVIEILNLMECGEIVTIGMGLDSKRIGKKDIVKVENRMLTKDDLDRISLISPNATINIIKSQKVAEKFTVEIPDEIKGIARCSNPNCITNHEPVESRFRRVADTPSRFRCHYCERSMDVKDMHVNHT